MSIEFKPVNEFKAEVFWGGEAFGHIVWGAGAKAFIPLAGPPDGPSFFSLDVGLIEGILRELASKP